MERAIQFLQKYHAAAVYWVAFAVYCYTLAPGLAHIDAGELTTVQATLSIAHPTGYPLFSILGWLFLKIPLPFSVSYQANLLCAIWTAGGAYFFTKLLGELLSHSPFLTSGTKDKNRIGGSKKKAPRQSPDYNHDARITVFSASAGGMLLAFSKTYWLQSTSVEVYSLQLFLMLCSLWIFFSEALRPEPLRGFFRSRWWLFALCMGASFANHGMSIFLLPGLLYFFFQRYSVNRATILHFTTVAGAAALVTLLLYIYLLLRSQAGPPMNWGEPNTLRKLLFHISGTQYSQAMFSSKTIVEYNLINFLKSVPFEFAWGPLLLTLAGIWAAVTAYKKLGMVILLGLVVNLALALNYNIRDIYTYYFYTYISLALLTVLGLNWLLYFLRRYQQMLAAVTLLFLAVEFYLNLAVSHRHLYTYDDYTKQLLGSLQPNAILFSSLTSDWDTFTSQAVYYQLVEGYRRDVTVLDAGLMGMPWFHATVERLHPGFFAELRGLVAECRVAEERFKEERSASSKLTFNLLYAKLLKEIITTYTGKRPIYFTPEFVRHEYRERIEQLPRGAQFIPDFLAYRVITNPKEYQPLPAMELQIRLPEYKNAYVQKVVQNCLDVLLPRAKIYEAGAGNPAEAERVLAMLRRNFPGMLPPDVK